MLDKINSGASQSVSLNDFNLTVKLSELLWKTYRINSKSDLNKFSGVLTEDKILSKLGCGEVDLSSLGDFAYDKSPMEYTPMIRTDKSGFDYIGRFNEIIKEHKANCAVVDEKGLFLNALVVFPTQHKPIYHTAMRQLAEERMKFADNSVVLKKDVLSVEDMRIFATVLQSNNIGAIGYSDADSHTLYFLPVEQEKAFEAALNEFKGVKNKLNNIEVIEFNYDKNLGKYVVEKIPTAQAYALKKALKRMEDDGVYFPAVEFYNTDDKGQTLIKYAMGDSKDESKKNLFKDLIEKILKENKADLDNAGKWQSAVLSNEVSLVRSLIVEGQGSDEQYLVKIPRTKGKPGDFQGEGKSKCLLINKADCKEDSNGNLIVALKFNEVHNIYDETGKQFSDTVNDRVNKMTADELREKFNKVSKFKDISPTYSTAINEREYVELYNKDTETLLQIKLESIDKMTETLRGLKGDSGELLFANNEVIGFVLKGVYEELNQEQKDTFLSVGESAINKDKNNNITAVDEDGYTLAALSDFLNDIEISKETDEESKNNMSADIAFINKLEKQYSVWKFLEDTGGENATAIDNAYESLKKSVQYEGERILVFDRSANRYAVLPKATEQELAAVIQASLKCSPIMASLITDKANENFSGFINDISLLSMDNGAYGGGSVLNNISFAKNGSEMILLKEDSGKLNTVCFDKDTERSVVEKRLSETFGITEQKDMAVILDRLSVLNAIQEPTTFKTPDSEYSIFLTTPSIFAIESNETGVRHLINKSDINEETLKSKFGLSDEGVAAETAGRIIESVGAYQHGVEKVKEVAVKAAKEKTKERRAKTVKAEKVRQEQKSQDADILKSAEKRRQEDEPGAVVKAAHARANRE